MYEPLYKIRVSFTIEAYEKAYHRHIHHILMSNYQKMFFTKK